MNINYVYTYLECHLNATAAHAEAHSVHVDVVWFSSWDVRELNKRARSVLIFEDRDINLNLQGQHAG